MTSTEKLYHEFVLNPMEAEDAMANIVAFIARVS